MATIKRTTAPFYKRQAPRLGYTQLSDENFVKILRALNYNSLHKQKPGTWKELAEIMKMNEKTLRALCINKKTIHVSIQNKILEACGIEEK